jgi:predicted dehydrogenase
MKNSNKTKAASRRSFIKKITLGTTAASTFPMVVSKAATTQKILLSRTYEPQKFIKNDQINLATIGFGIQGIYDTAAALTVDGVELVAVCDLYTGRLDRARELYGNALITTRDYREILERKDIDAVIIATPDHWHKKISIEAMKSGKAVYCEKPMIQQFDEGHEVIKAENDTKGLFQVGSQGMSSLGNEKARQLYNDGAIGQLVLVDMFNDRYSSEGAWQYPIPSDASPECIDFDTFLGHAPKVKYDPVRFFRWRNYRDYGTGVAGDLFVHAFSTLHYVINSHGPNRAFSTGGLRFWKDGRDVPDITLTMYDFPDTKSHPAFNAAFRINFIAGSGGGGGTKLVGTEGEMIIGSTSVTLNRTKMRRKPGGYSLIAYTEETQREIMAEYDALENEGRDDALKLGTYTFQAPDDYKGSHHDHFYNFFHAIRNGKNIREDATYGLRAAGAALLSNESYFQDKIVKWDPEAMKLL